MSRQSPHWQIHFCIRRQHTAHFHLQCNPHSHLHHGRIHFNASAMQASEPVTVFLCNLGERSQHRGAHKSICSVTAISSSRTCNPHQCVVQLRGLVNQAHPVSLCLPRRNLWPTLRAKNSFPTRGLARAMCELRYRWRCIHVRSACWKRMACLQISFDGRVAGACGLCELRVESASQWVIQI